MNQLIFPLKRGIHLPERKSISLQSPIIESKLPPQLFLPITQPHYEKAKVLVSVGDYVRQGQLLVKGNGLSGINIHSPSDGIISAIGPHPIANASQLPEITLTIDTLPSDKATFCELDESLETLKSEHCFSPMDWRRATPAELIVRASECGLVGLGGAGFPTARKLQAALQDVHTLIINAAECEPYITADHALLLEHAEQVIRGIEILLEILPQAECLIGIEENKNEAIEVLHRALLNAENSRIALRIIPTLYPSGAEKQLIYILTGQEVRSGKLTIESGYLCHNVGTAFALQQAVESGKALTHRIVTVTGDAVSKPNNYRVAFGTPVEFLLNQAGVNLTKLSTLIHGGPLMGLEVTSHMVPVTSISNCFIAGTIEEFPPTPPARPCIRCSYCADVCPAGLLPQQLYWFSRSQEQDKARAHHLFDCIECGACAYVCPSHIPLVHYYRAAKADIRVADEKQQMANHSKERFEFHQQRLALEKQQEESRRAERARLASEHKKKSSDTRNDAQALIAAALARVKEKKEITNKQKNKDKD
jgi:electron transport complex protein RnfC